jgi:penicillin G amidase
MPAKKKFRRSRLVVIGLVVVLVAGIAGGTFWSIRTVRASFPQTSGQLELQGLSGPVDVKRDANGIPQIYAGSDEDLFMAQGFVQAQDRFWEMDVRRHITAGRLSEMFGASQVKTDAFLRTLGWRRVAQREYDTKLSPQTKKYLQAYSRGVNAYLADHSGASLSLEYSVLGLVHDYTPEKWTPVDSVAWLKAMAWDLRGNMQDEIDRSLMTTRFTKDQIDQLYPPYPYSRNAPIVSGGAVNSVTKKFEPNASAGTTSAASSPVAQAQLANLANKLDSVPSLLGPAGSGIGSNSWVVSGKYTTTGKPLLANDPHLAPQLPSLWYQMGLHCRNLSDHCHYDVAGFTFSGMPGVVIGHNNEIAWGLTNLGADVTDLYLEKVTGDTYEYGGKQVKFGVRVETIKVAGGRDRRIVVRTTNNGPVVSDRDDELTKVGREAPAPDSAPDRKDGYAVALRWTALTPGRTMDAVFEIDRAQNFHDFRNASRDFAVPSQNLIYADRAGHIGYQAPGRIPIRGDGLDGTYPAPGWDPKARWKGYIPFDAMPYEYDPPRGFIVTANQAVTDSGYPYLLTSDWGYGTRSQRITDMIKAKRKGGGKISMDDMQSMQLDNTSEIAKILVPYLLKIHVRDSYVRQAQDLLRGWNHKQDPDSAAAAYFNAVWRNVLHITFGQKMPKELRVKGECLNVPPLAGSGPVDDLDGKPDLVRECGKRDPEDAQPDGSDRWYEVVRQILPDANNAWWNTSRDPGKITTRDGVLQQALKDARYELTAKLGKDISTWSWGRLHTLELRNQTLGKDGPGVVKWLFNRGPYRLGGGEAAVDATGWNSAGGYHVVWVPSMRMIVNLQDLDKSRWINLTGASGHVYNSNYTDQTGMWQKGQLLPWVFSKERVDSRTKHDMVLTR